MIFELENFHGYGRLSREKLDLREQAHGLRVVSRGILDGICRGTDVRMSKLMMDFGIVMGMDFPGITFCSTLAIFRNPSVERLGPLQSFREKEGGRKSSS